MLRRLTRKGHAPSVSGIAANGWAAGGGASLEFMEGKELPGVACLLDA